MNVSVILYSRTYCIYCFRKINHLVLIPFAFILWCKRSRVGNKYSRRTKSYFLKKKIKESPDKEGLVIERQKKTVNEQWHEIFFVSSTGNLISRLRLFSFRFHVGKNTNQRRPRHRWCQIKHSWFSNSVVRNNGRAVRSNTPPSLRHRWRCYRNVFFEISYVWDTADAKSATCEIPLMPTLRGVRHRFCRSNGVSDTADTYKSMLFKLWTVKIYFHFENTF